MKKVILGVILIGIAVIVGAPYANGLIMEKMVKKASADINKMYSDSGSDMTINILDYNRAFSSTNVTWKIHLGNLESIYGIKEIIVVEQAKHGHAGVVSKSSLAENKWFTDFVDQKLNGENPLDITTRYNLLGNVESTVSLAAFSVKDGEDTLAVKPGNVVIACGKGFTSFSSKGSWEGMELADQLKIDHISFDSTMEKLSTYIWAGDGSVTMKQCQATQDKDPIEISNLTCDYTMDYKKGDNTVSMGLDYGADRVAFEGNKIDDAFVHIGINRMDAQGYEELMSLYTQILNTSMSGMANAQNDPDQAEAIMQQQLAAKSLQLITAFEKVLKNGLEIEVSKLKVTLPEGDIKGDLAVGLKKDVTMAQFIPLISEPKLALDMITLRSDLSLPASLVGDNPALLTPAYPGMQTGLFKIDGAQVVHKAETKDGKLILNGQEVILN